MQTKVLISPRERISRILGSRPVDRIGVFDLDIEFYSEEGPKSAERFFLFGFDGPFQRISRELGLEKALIKFIQQPRQSLYSFKEGQAALIAEYRALKEKGRRFDGAWMGEDIAYDKGLYFSIEKYRRQLLEIHRDLSDFFAAEGLPLFFHCDGKVEELIPLLVDARVKAVHPLQELSNPNLLKLKRELKGSITFVGGVGLHRLRQDRQKLAEYIKVLKEGENYVFSFDGPIPDNFDKKEYDKLIKHVIASEHSSRSCERSEAGSNLKQWG